MLTAMIAFAATASMAQASFSLGIKGGPNFASIDGDNLSDVYGNRTGYHAGAFANIRIQRLGIQPEIMFSNQGSELNLAVDEVHKFNFVNIPVIVKYYPVDFLNIQVGPQFGFLTSQEIERDGVVVAAENIYKETDMSLALGLGLELPFGLTVDGRYNVGISDINDDPLVDVKLQQQVYQVSVGFKFIDLGK